MGLKNVFEKQFESIKRVPELLVTIFHNALIVNKVPTKRIIGEKVNDRKFQGLDMSFKYKLFLKDDSHE